MDQGWIHGLRPLDIAAIDVHVIWIMTCHFLQFLPVLRFDLESKGGRTPLKDIRLCGHLAAVGYYNEIAIYLMLSRAIAQAVGQRVLAHIRGQLTVLGKLLGSVHL
ncbi:MAG: hypothetical protein AMK72_14510 [Planctomycetes bacterium SM23_25]|nr:MAG: hypothetical protein AMK72_14510 [Planctomycetes bacterium SM23_25]